MINDALLPLTLIPGVGVAIMSTVHLSTQLSKEMQHLLESPVDVDFILEQKLRQLKRLGQSLFCLYASTSTFLFAALAGLLFATQPLISILLLSIGIITWIIALVLLTRFASKAIHIKQQQFALHKKKPG